MILNNTQANIFKVNGGIADDFANRPAANGSFYIFYSIDTQEIFYDNGAWVLLGSGGGGGVNIYNTDGTLTGNRTLSGANNDLTFADLNVFKTSSGGIVQGLKLDFVNQEFTLGYEKNNSSNIIVQSSIIETQLGGGISEGIQLNNSLYIFGDYLNLTNGTKIYVDDFQQIIKTQIGVNDIGLKLDFANTIYQFGQITGGNTTYLNINDSVQQFSVFNQSQSKGLYLDFQSSRYFYGEIFGLNAAYIEVDASQQRIITKGTTPGQSRGLDLFPNSSQYYFGNSSDLNITFIQVNDTNQNIYTSNQGAVKGLNFDFANSIYSFGQVNSGNITKLIISDAGREIYTSINNSINGLLISQSADNYKFGVINGGNVTNITISDGAVYPIRLNGTNLISGTAGGNSGQHLKININGTNYKLRLENP